MLCGICVVVSIKLEMIAVSRLRVQAGFLGKLHIFGILIDMLGLTFGIILGPLINL